jgi:flavorubredoxin
MARIPDTPIYCTANGEKSLRGHYHQDWNFQIVKTGDSLDLGNGKQLVFVEMPMLHWPDSMATYLTDDAVLFSNDAFGQHYASAQMFNDQCDPIELQEECIKYYANILTPFSPLVTQKIHEVLELNLPIDMIATSHGIIWRDNPTQIVEQYLQWADNYQENQITLVYDTMWNGTRMMAEAIAAGIRKADPEVVIKLFNLSNSDKNDVLTHVFKSKAILVGSPTVNNVMLPHVAALLEEMTGLRFKNKAAASFGTYGWNGGAVERIADAWTMPVFVCSIPESLPNGALPTMRSPRACALAKHSSNNWQVPDRARQIRRAAARGATRCAARPARGSTTRNRAMRPRVSLPARPGRTSRKPSFARCALWVKATLSRHKAPIQEKFDEKASCYHW